MTKTAIVTTPHPFARLQNPSRWEITRMVFGILSGFVFLRLFLFMGSILVLGSLTVVLHHSGLSAMCVYSLRFLCRWLLFVSGHFWIPIQGHKDNKIFEKGNCPKIIVSNHISNMEILHLLTFPFQDSSGNPVLPVFVTKATIFGLPVIGTITKDVLGSIGVTRKQKDKSKEQETSKSSTPMSCTEQIIARVKDKSNKYGPIVIFPEGTTTNGTSLLKFRKGAFVPMVPVVPVLYSFGANASDPERSDFLPTYESIWGPAYLWRLFSQLYHPLECQILDTIQPNQDANVFAQQARSSMALASGLPMLDETHNYAHKLTYHGGLRKAFLQHPRGPTYAMCFAPMQRVFDTSGDFGYDVVKGTKFVENDSDLKTKTNYGSID